MRSGEAEGADAGEAGRAVVGLSVPEVGSAPADMRLLCRSEGHGATPRAGVTPADGAVAEPHTPHRATSDRVVTSKTGGRHAYGAVCIYLVMELAARARSGRPATDR